MTNEYGPPKEGWELQKDDDIQDRTWNKEDTGDQVGSDQNQESSSFDKDKKKRFFKISKPKRNKNSSNTINATQKKIILGGVVLFIVLAGGYFVLNAIMQPRLSPPKFVENKENTVQDERNRREYVPVKNKSTQKNNKIKSAFESKVKNKNGFKDKLSVQQNKNNSTDIDKKINRIEKDIKTIDNKIAMINEVANKNYQKIIDKLNLENKHKKDSTNKSDNISKDKINDLKQKLKKIKKDKEEIKGKYEWLRHLYQKRKDEIAQLKKKINIMQSKIARFKDRPLFPGWKIIGMGTGLAVLSDGQDIKRLEKGEVFQGAKIEKIDVKNKKLVTSDGSISFRN